jgi:hypothetical protein
MRLLPRGSRRRKAACLQHNPPRQHDPEDETTRWETNVTLSDQACNQKSLKHQPSRWKCNITFPKLSPSHKSAVVADAVMFFAILAVSVGFFVTTVQFLGDSISRVYLVVSKSDLILTFCLTIIYASKMVACLLGLVGASLSTGFLYGALGYSLWQSLRRTKSPKTPPNCCKKCAICLTGIQANQERNVLPCKHEYHRVCLEKWLVCNKSCPTCRHKL